MNEEKLRLPSRMNYADPDASSASDAFASPTAYSLNPATFTPFSMPYYNPGIFLNQNYSMSALQNLAGFQYWNCMPTAADYMLNLTAIQNMQAVAAAANHCNDSFYDVLNKISPSAGCGIGDKDFFSKCLAYSTPNMYSPAHTPIGYQAPSEVSSNRPSSSRTYVSTPFANNQFSGNDVRISSPKKTSSSLHYNLATLAEVASCLTPPEVFTKSMPSSRSTPSSYAVDLNGRGCSNDADTKYQEDIGANYNNNNSFVVDESRFDTWIKEEEYCDESADLNARFEFKLDQNLLNASAAAWAALTGQFFTSVERATEKMANQRQDTKLMSFAENIVKPEIMEQCTKESCVVEVKPKRAYKRRVAGKKNVVVPSTSNANSLPEFGPDPPETVDLIKRTIDDVVRVVCLGETCKKRPYPYRDGDARTGTQSSIAVENGCSNEALDLTTKKHKIGEACLSPASIAGSSQQVDVSRITSDVLFDSKDVSKPKKRRVAEITCVRMPLLKGWRRQTCVRCISSSGVRGDVIYYTPCGRRLTSCGEVIRYLKKHPDDDISRQHFSFSSKVLVGEYLHVTPGGMEQISETDVKDIIRSMQQKRSKGFIAPQTFITTDSSIDESVNDKVDSCSNLSSNFLDQEEKIVATVVGDLLTAVAAFCKLNETEVTNVKTQMCCDETKFYGQSVESSQTNVCQRIHAHEECSMEPALVDDESKNHVVRMLKINEA